MKKEITISVKPRVIAFIILCKSLEEENIIHVVAIIIERAF